MSNELIFGFYLVEVILEKELECFLEIYVLKGCEDKCLNLVID